MGKKQVVNQEQFLSFVGDDQDEAQRMAELFIKQAGFYLCELHGSITSKNPQEWHDVAHKFKGMCGFAGADCLFNACYEAQAGWQETTNTKIKLFKTVEQETLKTTSSFKHLYGRQGE